MGRRVRAYVRRGVFVTSCVLVIGLVALWVDSYRMSTSLSYSHGEGVPAQATPLPGEQQGMWHDTVDSVGLFIKFGVVECSSSRLDFAFYDRPKDSDLFRGFLLVRRHRTSLPLGSAPVSVINAALYGPDLRTILVTQLAGFGVDAYRAPTATHVTLHAPMSIVVLIAALPAALIGFGWFRQRRRERGQGSCVRCRYDRRGIAADMPCPECGTSPDVPSEPLRTPR